MQREGAVICPFEAANPSHLASLRKACDAKVLRKEKNYYGAPHLAEAGGGRCAGGSASILQLHGDGAVLLAHACLDALGHVEVGAHVHRLLLSPVHSRQYINA